MVAWINAACPNPLGGLGIPNLSTAGLVLRMRWLCLARVDADKTWAGFSFRHIYHTKSFFNVYVSAVVRKGDKALFWSECRLNGCDIQTLAPNLWAAISPQVRNKRTVREGLLNHHWVCEISHDFTVQVLIQHLCIWDLLLHAAK